MKNYKAVLFAVMVMLFFSCSEEKKLWEEAKAKNTVAAYKSFIEQNPNSAYADSANSKLELFEWENTTSNDQISSYRVYLKKYPDGKYAKEARIKIDSLAPSFSQVEAVLNISLPDGLITNYSGEYVPKLPDDFFSPKSEDWSTARDIIVDPLFLNDYQTKRAGHKISNWPYVARIEHYFYQEDDPESPPSVSGGCDTTMAVIIEKHGKPNAITSFTFEKGDKATVNWYGPIFIMADEENNIKSLGGFPSLLLGDKKLKANLNEDIKTRMEKIKAKLISK